MTAYRYMKLAEKASVTRALRRRRRSAIARRATHEREEELCAAAVFGTRPEWTPEMAALYERIDIALDQRLPPR